MARMGLRDALVVQSQAVDEHPVWSPSGKQLAVNIEGQWLQIDLDSVALKPGDLARESADRSRRSAREGSRR